MISLVGTYGKVSVVPHDIERGIINPRLLKISPDNNKVVPAYLKYLLTSEFVRGQIARRTHGATMGILNLNIVRELMFPIPSLEEQHEITKILLAFEHKFLIEKQRKEQLEELKKGLMQVLLTGKVRVKVGQEAH